MGLGSEPLHAQKNILYIYGLTSMIVMNTYDAIFNRVANNHIGCVVHRVIGYRVAM